MSLDSLGVWERPHARAGNRPWEEGRPGWRPSSAADWPQSWESHSMSVGLCFLLYFLLAKIVCSWSSSSWTRFLRSYLYFIFKNWDWGVEQANFGDGSHCLVPSTAQGHRAIVPALWPCWADLHQLTVFSLLISSRTRDPGLGQRLLCHEQPSELWLHFTQEEPHGRTSEIA